MTPTRKAMNSLAVDLGKFNSMCGFFATPPEA